LKIKHKKKFVKYENIFKGAYERPEKYVPKNKKEL